LTASHFTPRLALPYPDESDPADVPLDLANLANKLDTVTARAAGAALTAAPVLDVGVAGQIRAGRQLALADFAALGLAAPLGLWNLSDLTDVSGNGRALTNKGAVPFGTGINGAASSAAVFAGSTAQALYIADTGAADPFRIKTGSWGCWFRTAKRGVEQAVISKWATTGSLSWWLGVASTNTVKVYMSSTGSDAPSFGGVSDICEDRWHLIVATHDGTTTRLYVDGVVEAAFTFAAPIFGGASPLNIGANTADGATAAASPFYGRVDEAFVTADVLSPEQVRALYCAKLAHGFAVTPTGYALAVRRRRRGGPLAVADFPTQPLRLHNLTGGSLGDEGSGAVALVNNGAAVSVAGADGAAGGAYSFAGTQSLSATDAGLPAGAAARSYGAWFKTTQIGNGTIIVAWGATGNRDALYTYQGQLTSASAGDAITAAWAVDGQWRFALVVEDGAAGDGVKRKLYLDGQLVGGSTVLGAIALGGAGHFRIGADVDGTLPFTGQIDGAFVCGYALTRDQVSTLYAKGSQVLASSPKNAGDHVEYADATNVYAVFDTLDSQHQIDLAVTG
jgi:hypothetical protein